MDELLPRWSWEFVLYRSGPVPHRELGLAHRPSRWLHWRFGIRVESFFVTSSNFGDQTNYTVTGKEKLLGWSRKKNCKNHNLRAEDEPVEIGQKLK